MVTKSGTLFRCDASQPTYRDQYTAEKCQAWCKQHGTCHMETTRHAVTDT